MPNSATPEPKPAVKLIDFVAFATLRLKNAGIDGAGTDARILIAHGLKLDRAEILSQSERILTDREMRRLTIFIECRARHEPVSRIFGEREFWSLPFGLNEATLDPRPDSEILVETALRLLAGKAGPLRLLDLGTGTGCLLLALLHELPHATGLGIDKSPRAVEQAQINAERLALAERAAFQTGDWLDGIGEKFDLIISNPPYIAQKDIAGLMPEVRDFDPHLALDGGNDGRDAYRLLVPQLPRFLKESGHAVLEVGAGQAQAIAALLGQADLSGVAIHKDLSGIERCVAAAIDKAP